MSSAPSSSSRYHVGLCCTAFKDIEAVDEMEHEVGGQRIGCGVPNIVGRDASANVAALLQDIVYLETQGAVFLFEELFLQGSVPQPLLLLEAAGIARVGVVRYIALDRKIVGQVDDGVGRCVVIEVFLILLPFQTVSHIVVVDIAAYAEVDDVRPIIESEILSEVCSAA